MVRGMRSRQVPIWKASKSAEYLPRNALCLGGLPHPPDQVQVGQVRRQEQQFDPIVSPSVTPDEVGVGAGSSTTNPNPRRT